MLTSKNIFIKNCKNKKENIQRTGKIASLRITERSLILNKTAKHIYVKDEKHFMQFKCNFANGKLHL